MTSVTASKTPKTIQIDCLNASNEIQYYLIADLHLSENRPETLNLFEAFLINISQKSTTLYILGDFFDYWIGDDVVSDFHQQVINLLATAHDKGLVIYFMAGNRDFLVGKRFAKQAKLQLINDPYTLSIANKNILLMHGDLLCTDDSDYQKFRKISRNKIIQFIYLAMPVFYRKYLAKKARAKSKLKNEKYKIVDVTKAGIDHYIGAHSILIHGHTHLFNTHYEKDYTRYVLSDWFKNGSYIHINQEGKITLEKLVQT